MKENCVNVYAVPVYVVRWSTESCNGPADRRKRRQHCHVSEVTDYPRIKKSDDHRASSLLLTLKRPLLVTGDVIVEFFNKPKMMKKVLKGFYDALLSRVINVAVAWSVSLSVSLMDPAKFVGQNHRHLTGTPQEGKVLGWNLQSKFALQFVA